MIASLCGEVRQIYGDSCVIDVGGVGYHVYMPLSALEELSRFAEKVLIHTYLHHKEETMTLYGFLRPEDKNLFIQAIGVSGIGPKTALAILSVLSAERFRRAVLTEDAKALTDVPGIGLKTAQRLILELKSKIAKGGAKTVSSPQERGISPEYAPDDAVAALIALGYTHTVAAEAVDKVWREEPNLAVPDLVRRALKLLVK